VVLPGHLAARIRVPLIAAPMLRVSGPRLVSTVCRAGAVGAFPVANAGSTQRLAAWLHTIGRAVGESDAPYCPNLIVRHPALDEQVDCLVRHGVELVITSVGSPAPVLGRLHDAGAVVLADVATLDHAHKAVDAGVDGLVLLSAGAGGQTGRLNPFAFVRAVRRFFDGVVALAGGISDGVALRAAHALGADLGCMGTRFIATTESMATPEYREMLVDSTMDDVLLTSAFTGLPTSMLRPAVVAAGLDPDTLEKDVSPATADELFGAGGIGPRRWVDVFSAGHAVSGVEQVGPAAAVVAQTWREFLAGAPIEAASPAGH
jgi:nitronate monooxygenase